MENSVKNLASSAGIESYIQELMAKPSSSFQWATKLDARSFDSEVVEELVYEKGCPVVLSNTTRPWQRDREMFGFDWLRKNFGQTVIHPRDNDSFTDFPEWHLSDYLDFIQKPQRERRLYGKDIPCPPQWKDFVAQKLPEFCCKGPNDLMSELVPELQAETLMIYVGVDETCTPGHFDILGSLGHNIMVYADEGACALWFCVAKSDRDKAIEFWKAKSGGTIYEDNAFLSPEELCRAPFTVYVIIQREGDFVLVPSEAAHQVINKVTFFSFFVRKGSTKKE